MLLSLCGFVGQVAEGPCKSQDSDGFDFLVSSHQRQKFQAAGVLTSVAIRAEGDDRIGLLTTSEASRNRMCSFDGPTPTGATRPLELDLLAGFVP